jgi:hypothetical protein
MATIDPTKTAQPEEVEITDPTELAEAENLFSTADEEIEITDPAELAEVETLFTAATQSPYQKEADARAIAIESIGTGAIGKGLSGQKAGWWETAKDVLNMQTLGSVLTNLGRPERITQEITNDTNIMLDRVYGDLRDRGFEGEEANRIISDASKEYAWTEQDEDKLRSLSSGELVINPSRVFGDDKAAVEAEIAASSATPEQKQTALRRLEGMRSALADKMESDLYMSDSGFKDFADKWEGDKAGLMDAWVKQQKDRNWLFKSGDAVLTGVQGGAVGIAGTVTDTAAGISALVGAEDAAGAIGETGTMLRGTQESISQAAEQRGLTGGYGIAQDFANTVTQMAPMLIGGAAVQGVKGVAAAATRGTSVYGWAAAQGYGSKLQDAIAMKQEELGRELTEQEIAGVLADGNTQTAAFSNGLQTALLAKVLGGGAERAALGAAEKLTVADFLTKGGRQAFADAGFRNEIKQMGRTIFGDVADEAVEEGLNQFLDKAISSAALGQDVKVGDLVEEVFGAAAMGGLVGGVVPQARFSNEERVDPLDMPVKVPFAERAVTELVTPEVQEVAPASAAAALATPPAQVVEAPTTEAPASEAAVSETPTENVGQLLTQVAETPTEIPAAETDKTPTTALDKTALKTAFDLTDEQADAAVEVSRALGLSPERVLVEREFDEVMTPEVKATAPAAAEAAMATPTPETPAPEATPQVTGTDDNLTDWKPLLERVYDLALDVSSQERFDSVMEALNQFTPKGNKQAMDTANRIAGIAKQNFDASQKDVNRFVDRRVGGKLAQGRGKTTSLGDKLRAKPDLFTEVPKSAVEAGIKRIEDAKNFPTAKAFGDSLKKAISDRQPNITDTPYEGDFVEGELSIDDRGENPYVYENRYIDPREFKDVLKLEGMTYDQVVSMPTTQKYIQWYKEGKLPPPVDVVIRWEDGRAYASNRRRMVAALEAGVNRVPARVEIGRRNEVFEQAKELGAEEPQPTSPTTLSQPDLLTAPRKRSLSSMRAEVIRKLDELEAEPTGSADKGMKLKGLLGRIETAMLGERKVAKPATKKAPKKKSLKKVSNDTKPEPTESAKQPDTRRFNVVKVMPDGSTRLVSRANEPMTQDEAVTFRSKFSNPADFRLDEVTTPPTAGTPKPLPKTFPKSFNKIATAPTREGIEKQIAKYYGGESKTLVPIEGRAGYYAVAGGRGVIDGVVVVEVARGWGFGTEAKTASTAAQSPSVSIPTFSTKTPPTSDQLDKFINGMSESERVAFVKASVKKMQDGDPNIGREWNSIQGRLKVVGLVADGGTTDLTDPRYEAVLTGDPTKVFRYGSSRLEDAIQRAEYALTPEYAEESRKFEERLRQKEEREARVKADTESREARLDPYLDVKTNTPMQRGKLRNTLLHDEARQSGETGKIYRGNRFELTEQMLADGYKPTSEEISVKEDLSRLSDRERMNRDREQKTRTEYRLENNDGRSFVITKAEYDLAQWLMENGAPTDTTERFQAPTTTDAAYFAAVEAGDMETAQAMVDEAAKTLIESFPASSNSNDVPNTGSIGSSLDDYQEFGVRDVPLSLFSGMGKKAYYTAADHARVDRLMESIRAEGIQSPLIVVIDGHPDGTAYVLEGAHRLAAAEELRLPSLPALVVYDNSADPVVRDDDGNIIPPSQRFNPANEDIRYQSTTPEQKFQSYLDGIKKYETSNWDSLTTEQKNDDLKRFTETALRNADFRATETPNNSQRMLGGELVRVESGRTLSPRSVTKQGVLGDISIILGSAATDDVGGKIQSAVKAEIAMEIDEELVHAAHLISLASRAPDGDAMAEAARVFDQIIAQDISVEESNRLARAVSASLSVYNNVVFSEESLQSLTLDLFKSMPPDTKARTLAELVRQVVQLRSKGEITESTFKRIANTVKEWFEASLNILRGLASNPNTMGDAFANEVRTVEAILNPPKFQNRPQGAKGSAQLTPEGKVLLKGLQNPDFTTAVHEMAHAFEMSEYQGLNDDEVSTLKAWAGSKSKGRKMMETKASEKFARGWERYIAERRAPLPNLQAIFDKMAKWMLDVYGSITNAEINIKISPEVRAIFDKLASRMVAPAAIVTPSGVEMHTDDGSALPPAIAPNEPAPPDMSAEDEFVGRWRDALESPKPPPQDDWNPDDLYSLQERRALEEAEVYDLNTDGWEQAARTFGDLWDNVTSQPQGTGEAMLDRLVATGDIDRVLTDMEVATLTHEGLRRKVAVDKAAEELGTVIAQGASKELVAEKQSALDEATARYQTIQNVAAKARTASGRALNAWKYALRNDFSYATLQSRTLAAYNSALIQDGQKPVAELPADQKEKIRKYSEEQRALQEEISRLRAAAETASPDEYMKRIAEQDALIAAMVEERKQSAGKSAVSDLTKRLLVDKVRQAAREARARLGIADDGIRYQSAPNAANDPRWYDRVLVLAEPLIANPTMSAARFADIVLKQFGSAFEGVADLLRKDTERHIRTTLADISGQNSPTPEEVVSGISADQELTRQDVYELARAYVFEGARDFEVMDKVFADLSGIYPDLTKDEVTQLFTNYGKQQKLSPTEEAKALRAARALELVQKQIDDLETSGQMKRTGLAKDEPSVKLRELRKRRDDLAKEIGYTPTDPKTGLSSAQGAAKKRMANEIQELEKAIASGERRVRVRRGVEYTEDMNVLREKLLALRDTYENIFESERTPEERMRLILTDLDRRIAKERDLINKGIIREAKAALPPLDSPELTARRELLKELRKEKFAAYDLLNPNERALSQAMKEAEDAVKRRQKLLDEGLRETPQKRERGEGVNPTEALQALWEAADALDVLIKEIRKNRPLTPAQQQRQLDLAYKQAVEAREKLRTRIETGDILAAPKTPKAVEERTRAIREENAAMRKQIVQMQRDAGVGAFSPEVREAKRVASLESRIAELRRRRDEKDFSKKTVAKPVTNEKIAQLELQLEYAKFKFEEDRARDAFKGLKWTTKNIEIAMAAWHARQMFNLSGDFGIFGRQLGKVRTLVLWEDAKALLKRARAGEPLNVREGTILGKTLGAGLKVFLDPKKGDEFYADFATSPRYAFLKANGLDLTKPHESSHELNSDGRVRVNPMMLFNNRVIAAIMIGKGLIGTAAGVKVALHTGAPVWQAITKGIGDTLFGAGLAVGGVAFARRVEAAQVTMLNLARVGVTEAMLEMTDGLDPSAKESASQDIVEAVMTLTGKIAGKGDFSKWLKNNSYMVGLFVQFPQYKYTNLKSAAGTPLWSALWNAMNRKEGSKQTLAAVSTMMAHMYAGYAARMMVWAVLLGVWDEDDEESTYGVVMNPNNPNFGKLKIGKTYLDLAPGWGTWFVDFTRFASDTKLDPAMLREGYEVEEAKTSFDKSNVMKNFLMKQLPANIVTLNDIRVGEFREGGELEKMDWANRTDMILSQIIMNLTARDIKKIYEEHDPVMATTLASLVMTGQNINIRETGAEKEAREAEEQKRFTVTPE